MKNKQEKNASSRIRGAKKGGGGGRIAVEAKDSLQSKAYARVLDLLSEGEIEGLVNGAQSIYLDGTSLQNANGEYNFEGVSVELRKGTQGQLPIPDFSMVENEINVNVEVKHDVPVVRTISNPNIDAVRVKVVLPQLSRQDPKTGDVGGTSVRIAFDVEAGSGGFVQIFEDEISGKTMSRYERQYRIDLTGSAPWKIRMRRVSEDSSSAALTNNTWFSSMTEIVSAKLSYPNSAIVGLRIDSSQFSSIPTRAYHVKLLRIRVPSNYNAETREYNGVWDGQFNLAWSNNPAWCFYDLLTDKRYGLGKHIDERAIDKWSLYTIGRYCDDMLPNGFGGREPRFALNCYLQTRQDAYTLLNDLASAFRGMLYWAGGAIVASQDAPADASYLFTNSNVIDGEFSYSGTSVKTRHTVALVSWNDLSDMGRQKIEYVEDRDGIDRYGIVETEVAAFGCTSRAQAHRVGRWILYSEIAETETVIFKTGFEGAVARPGQLIKIRDNYRYGGRLGGRVVGSTSNSIQLDAPVKLESGKNYTLHVIKPDGSVHESSIRDYAGERDTLTLSRGFGGELPVGQSTWILAAAGEGRTQDYRVISIAEKEPAIYEIVALQHDASKFEKIDGSVKFDSYRPGGSVNPGDPGYPGPNPDGIPAPTDLHAEVISYEEGSIQRFKIMVSWASAQGVAYWELEWKHDNDNPVLITDLVMPTYDIREAQIGYYSLRVRAVTVTGQKSPWAEVPQVYVNSRDVHEFLVNAWAKAGFLKILVGWEFHADAIGIARVEVWGKAGTAESYGEPELLATVPYPSSEWVHADRSPGELWTYWLKVYDQYGNSSDFYPSKGVSAAAHVDVTDIIDSLDKSFMDSRFGRYLVSRIEEIEFPEDLQGLLDGTGAIYDEIARIKNDQNRGGNLLLRSVLVDEEVKQEARDGVARALDAVSIVEDGLALEVNRRTVLEARVEDTEAAIVSEQTARADGDSALATQLTALTADFESEIADTQALIVQEQTVRASETEALAKDTQGVIARLDNFNGEQGKSAEAAWVEETQARVREDEAVVSQVSGLVAGLGESLEAKIAAEAEARAKADEVYARDVRQVSAELGQAKVAVQQEFVAQANVNGQLLGQYTVKIDSGGRVASFGLAQESSQHNPNSLYSTFAVAADRFVICGPGENGRNKAPAFQVVTSRELNNGVWADPGVYMRDAYIQNGMITSAKIGNAAVETLKIAGGSVTSMAYGTGIPTLLSIHTLDDTDLCYASIEMPGRNDREISGVVITAMATISGADRPAGCLIKVVRDDGLVLGQNTGFAGYGSQVTVALSVFDPDRIAQSRIYRLKAKYQKPPNSDSGVTLYGVTISNYSITATGGKR